MENKLTQSKKAKETLDVLMKNKVGDSQYSIDCHPKPYLNLLAHILAVTKLNYQAQNTRVVSSPEDNLIGF